MRYSILRHDVKTADDGETEMSVLPFFGADSGCQLFEQRILCLGTGGFSERRDEDNDEVLFVLAGSPRLTLAGEEASVITPWTGVFLGRGVSWSLEADDAVELLSVVVRSPEPTGAGTYAVVDLLAEQKGEATAGREFTLGVTPDSGCPSVTQFIGYIPPGRAPDHYHLYDEVLMILDGTGVLHIGGETAPLEAGTCVHLPRTLVHSLENAGDGEMRLLGVFRPGGSPAEAYYPDGTRAVYTPTS